VSISRVSTKLDFANLVIIKQVFNRQQKPRKRLQQKQLNFHICKGEKYLSTKTYTRHPHKAKRTKNAAYIGSVADYLSKYFYLSLM